jgi:hypothetical protein
MRIGASKTRLTGKTWWRLPAIEDKNEALPPFKTPTADQASFNVRVDFAAHRSLAIRAVQTAVSVAEK